MGHADFKQALAFAHTVIDAGADLVLGHGPHVPRALELYKDRLIAYSLGNFATYQGVNIQGDNGLAPVVMAQLSSDGRFLHGRIISAKQLRPEGTVLDPGHAAAVLMRRLSQADFPTSPLLIGGDGKLSRGSDSESAP